MNADFIISASYRPIYVLGPYKSFILSNIGLLVIILDLDVILLVSLLSASSNMAVPDNAATVDDDDDFDDDDDDDDGEINLKDE